VSKASFSVCNLITEVTWNPRYILVRCQGRCLCRQHLEPIAVRVRERKAEPTAILIDLSKLESIRSADVAMLWVRLMEAKAGGWQIAFVRLPRHLRLFLANCGLGEVLPNYRTESAASLALTEDSELRLPRAA